MIEDIVFIIISVAIIIFILLLGKKYSNKSKEKIESEIFDIILHVCNQHIVDLTRERLKTKRELAYGIITYDQWYSKGLMFFYNNIVLPNLGKYSSYVENNVSFKKECLHIIDEIADENESIGNNIEKINLSGEEYEMYIMQQLDTLGFSCSLTKTTGDQGVDLLARYKNKLYAIQCKYYSNSVGNKAVQEIISGKLFYNADFAIVITNSKYTKSAYELANISGVGLLHDTEISNILEYS